MLLQIVHHDLHLSMYVIHAHMAAIYADVSLEEQLCKLTEKVEQLASRLEGIPEQQQLHQQALHMLASHVGQLDASVQLLAEPEVNLNTSCVRSARTHEACDNMPDDYPHDTVAADSVQVQ